MLHIKRHPCYSKTTQQDSTQVHYKTAVTTSTLLMNKTTSTPSPQDINASSSTKSAVSWKVLTPNTILITRTTTNICQFTITNTSNTRTEPISSLVEAISGPKKMLKGKMALHDSEVVEKQPIQQVKESSSEMPLSALEAAKVLCNLSAAASKPNKSVDQQNEDVFVPRYAPAKDLKEVATELRYLKYYYPPVPPI